MWNITTSNIQKIIGKILLWIFYAFAWLWVGAKAIMDWIGRSALPQDVENAQALLGKGLGWLFSTPWWVPALLATALTGTIIFLSLRQNKAMEVPPSDETQISNDEKQLTEIVNRVFNSETVLLDGHRYIACKFINCTIQWNGGDFQVLEPKWEEGYAFVSANPVVNQALNVFNWLKLIGNDTKVATVMLPKQEK